MKVEEADLIREGRLQRVEKRQREFLSRRMMQDIIGEVIMDVGRYRLKEMATSLLDSVVEMAVEMSNINRMVRLITEYGPETRNKLENELRKQRMEEVEAIKMILKEGERELRLEYVEVKKNAWKREYYYMQDNILIRSMQKLDLEEVMVMDVDKVYIQEMDMEAVMYMETEEGGVEVMEIDARTIASVREEAEVMEESVVGLESQSEYPQHHGRVHTPLPGPATITENGVELGQVIGLHLTGEIDDGRMMDTEQRVVNNPEVEPEVGLCVGNKKSGGCKEDGGPQTGSQGQDVDECVCTVQCNIYCKKSMEDETGREVDECICGNFPSHSKTLHQLVNLRILEPELLILPWSRENGPFIIGKSRHGSR
jgi:hypothetical protein